VGYFWKPLKNGAGLWDCTGIHFFNFKEAPFLPCCGSGYIFVHRHRPLTLGHVAVNSLIRCFARHAKSGSHPSSRAMLCKSSLVTFSAIWSKHPGQTLSHILSQRTLAAFDGQNVDDARKVDAANTPVKMFRHVGGRTEAWPSTGRLRRKLEGIKRIVKEG
jgi:hypothetical protein